VPIHKDRRGYAYESFREGGRVCRRYIGGGEFCAVLLECERGRLLEARLRALDERDECERVSASADELKAFCAVSEALFGAWMNASGYHRPKRGVWRKARALQARKSMANTNSSLELASAQGKAQGAPTDGEYRALLKRAMTNKDAAREVLSKVKGTPEEAPLLELAASLYESAREALIQGSTKDELRRAGMRRQLEIQRDELAGPNASPLELHLAERVALCGLAVARLESLFMHNADNSPKVWEVCGRQLDGAHRRHLSAVKALAEVRRLQLPNVQVNIGEKQVNIGQVNAPEK